MPDISLKAMFPQGMHPTPATVASPPYPARHSHLPLSVFIAENSSQAHMEELVDGLPSLSRILDPGGQAVHWSLPGVSLKEATPQGEHPMLVTLASPLYPARHSHTPLPSFFLSSEDTHNQSHSWNFERYLQLLLPWDMKCIGRCLCFPCRLQTHKDCTQHQHSLHRHHIQQSTHTFRFLHSSQH